MKPWVTRLLYWSLESSNKMNYTLIIRRFMSNIFLKLNMIVKFKPVSLLNSKRSGLKVLQAWQDLTRCKVCDVSNVMLLTTREVKFLPEDFAFQACFVTVDIHWRDWLYLVRNKSYLKNLFPFLQTIIIFFLRKKYINWTVFMAKRQMRSVHLQTLTRVFRGFWGPRLEFWFFYLPYLGE